MCQLQQISVKSGTSVCHILAVGNKLGHMVLNSSLSHQGKGSVTTGIDKMKVGIGNPHTINKTELCTIAFHNNTVS